MSDIPIIMSAPMIRALLDGRKTMTRRLAWLENNRARKVRTGQLKDRAGNVVGRSTTYVVGPGQSPSRWQRVKPGDRLWVREAWRVHSWSEDSELWLKYPADDTVKDVDDADPDQAVDLCEKSCAELERANVPKDEIGYYASTERLRNRSPLHMPRWASRLTLIITAVKIERLQDISEEDAEAEGCEYEIWDQALAVRNYTKPDGWFCMWGGDDCYSEPGVYVPSDRIWQASFQSLWTSLHGPDSWSTNPEVVALSFNVVKANIDSPEARAT